MLSFLELNYVVTAGVLAAAFAVSRGTRAPRFGPRSRRGTRADDEDKPVGAVGAFLGAATPRAVVPLLTVHLNIVAYAGCYWLQQPCLPFLTKELGADAVVFGTLQTAFSLVQLVGGPLMGRVIDTRGGRLALLLSQTGASLSYLLMAASTSVEMLFVSQLPTILMHSMHSAQAIIALLSGPEARAAALGRLSLSYGVGMIAGSMLGGTLSKVVGHHGVALLAAVLSFATIPLSLGTLPGGRASEEEEEEEDDEDEDEDGDEEKKGSLSLAEAGRLLRAPACRALIGVQLFAGLGLSMQRSTFSLAAQEEFGLDAQQLGFIMSYAAAIAVLVNTFVVGRAAGALGERPAIRASLLLLAAAFVAYAFTPTFRLLLAVMVPMGVASTTMYTLLSSSMTKCVPAEDAGTAIGLSHAVRTLCGVIAPTVGGYLLAETGFQAVGFASAGLTVVGLVFIS